MIEFIEIRNFQSLEDVKLELGKFTVVVGPTNVGKTAVMRAVRAVVENKRGDTFIFRGAEACSVSIQCNGEDKIIWRKQPGSAGSYYKKNVAPSYQISPDKALSVLWIKKVQLTSSFSYLINFQAQLDLPFLISESDIVKSKVLGEITNASIVFSITSTIKQWIVANNQRLAIRREDLRKVSDKLHRMIRVPALEPILASCLTRFTEQAKQREFLQKLSSWDEEHQELALYLNKINKKIHSVRLLADKLDDDKINSVSRKIRSVEYIMEASRQTRQEIHVAKISGKAHDAILLNMPDLTRLELLMNQLTVYRGYKESLDDVERLRQLDIKQQKELEYAAEASDSQLEALKLELRICPVCEAPLI